MSGAAPIPVVLGEPVVAASGAAPTTDGEAVPEQSCAICFDSTDLILMPCCGREQASTRCAGTKAHPPMECMQCHCAVHVSRATF